MIDKKYLDKYQNQIRNSLCLAVKPEQTLAGMVTAMEYLQGCTSPLCVNGESMARHARFIQTFTYQNVRFYLVDRMWTMDKTRTYGTSPPFMSTMREDKDLKNSLVPRELTIQYKDHFYKWDPAEQILLGEEPCLVEIKQENK